VGVEIRESPVSADEFAEMERFVHDYLAASVANEDEGGRMRWYPWHSAEYAEEGARIAREYLETQADYPRSFVDQVCRSVREHSYQGDIEDVSLETQCLIEADILDKVGANGAALMLLRMGYESRTHMDAAEMVGRVIERGQEAKDRVESQTALDIAHRRLKRVRWFQEWLEAEVAGIED